MRAVSMVLLALVLGPIAASAQTHQDAMGVWVLNLQRSKFDPGPLPKRQTSTFTLMPDGAVKVEVDGINAQGSSFHSEMLSRFDGRQAPRTGSAQSTSRAYRWLDDRNFAFDELVNGQRSVTGRTSTSADGTVRTLRVDGMRNGKPLHNIEVYERQPGTATTR